MSSDIDSTSEQGREQAPTVRPGPGVPSHTAGDTDTGAGTSNGNATEKLVIFDTTLRDGEQAPGISLDPAEKMEIAEQLARLGVDYIEAGFPVSSQGDFDSVQAIARSVQGPVICGLSRTHVSDVDRCFDALRDAGRARIHVFISTSPEHMEYMLKMTPKQVFDEAHAAVARACEHVDDVEFSPQDATRTSVDFLLEILADAVAQGATTLNIPDTVGYGIPWDFAKLISHIRKEVPGDYIISTHCHNDLGLATSNTLAGVQAGARQVEVCVNGIGERAGNASLEEVVMAVAIRQDQFPGVYTGIHTEELARTSRLVSRLTGYPVQYNKAVVGRNAFAHEAGIHQHGVLSDRRTYEIIDAATVGLQGSQIVLGKHSGRHAFTASLEKMGIHAHGDVLDQAFRRFKDLADRKVEITEADLEAIVAEEIGMGVVEGYVLESLEVSGGTEEAARAKVALSRVGSRVNATAEGNGMIDAACKAIGLATSTDAELAGFNVSSVTGGIDALGDVVIQLISDGIKVSGKGVSTDVVEASARAYLAAVNRLIRAKERNRESLTRAGDTGP
ncbi:MAG: 2-isopropylmalate synthase [Actinobacteria bacterium]|nr:2-isopropylmalate synthase [Actinomycetota bacterium]MCL5446783.1 2-isopropylmalate synthase [Actinomycetota bacterium]